MKLTPTQAIVAKSQKRFRVINCGRRWGKTTLAIEEIKGKAVYSEHVICYIAPTIGQARDIAWAMLKKELQPIIVKAKESPALELEVRNIKGTTSIIKLRGWEAIETLRGQFFDLLILDEVASMRNFWIGWYEVLRPTLTDRIGDAIFISTPKGFNHFWTLYNKQNEDKDYQSFHFTSYDNPYNKKEELDKARTELNDNQFAQEYLADFKKVEGLVYNLPEDQIIAPLEDLSIKTEDRIMGVDWGFRNPSAIWVGYLKDKEWITVDEWEKTQHTTAEIIQVIKNKISEHKITKVYPDPAEPDRIEECRRAGINVREANKDVEGGISYVQNLIKEKRFKVCKNCVSFLSEINSYQFAERKDEHKELKEEPEKMNDHLMDAMRYAIFSHQGHNIKIGQASPLLQTYKL